MRLTTLRPLAAVDVEQLLIVMPRPSSGGAGWAGQRVSQVRGRDFADLAWFIDHGPGTCTSAYQQDTARGHEALDGVPRTRISDQTRSEPAPYIRFLDHWECENGNATVWP